MWIENAVTAGSAACTDTLPRLRIVVSNTDVEKYQ